MKRNHIHMASAYDAKSGFRPNISVVIELDATEMMKNGISIFQSFNGVLLTPGDERGMVGVEYFKSIKERRSGKEIDYKLVEV